MTWSLVALALASGCGLRHLARTVGQNQGELRAALGGPILGAAGIPFPVPSVRVGGRYGATDWLDLSGDLTVEPLAFGVLSLEAGVVVQLFRDPSFALSASGHAHLLFDLKNDVTTRGFPELGLHAEHRLAPCLLAFGGAFAIAQPEPPREKPPVFAAPYVGLELIPDPAASVRHGFVLQFAWVSPWEDFRSFADWRPEGAGVLVVVVGWRALLGAAPRPPETRPHETRPSGASDVPEE